MSITRCQKCNEPIDTDLDDCAVELPDYGDDGAFHYEEWCARCRARREAEDAREP